jgi:hypothetical protein
MHPVDAIVAAFAKQEGWFSRDPTVIPRARNNPLDLDFEGQIGAAGSSGKTATFVNSGAGIVAAYRQVWLWVAMGYSVSQMVLTQAPAPNDTESYLKNVLAWTGLPSDIPVLDFLPPLVQLGS